MYLRAEGKCVEQARVIQRELQEHDNHLGSTRSSQQTSCNSIIKGNWQLLQGVRWGCDHEELLPKKKNAKLHTHHSAQSGVLPLSQLTSCLLLPFSMSTQCLFINTWGAVSKVTTLWSTGHLKSRLNGKGGQTVVCALFDCQETTLVFTASPSARPCPLGPFVSISSVHHLTSCNLYLWETRMSKNDSHLCQDIFGVWPVAGDHLHILPSNTQPRNIPAYIVKWLQPRAGGLCWSTFKPWILRHVTKLHTVNSLSV